MPSATSVDLRKRVVEAYENGEGTYQDIAERFKIGVASVSRYLAMYRYGGDLSPRAAGGNRRGAAVSDEVIEHIVGLVTDEPNWTTQELAEEVEECFGLSLSRQRVGQLLRDAGYSFKRGSTDHGLPPSRRLSKGERPISTTSGIWTHPSSSSSTRRGSSLE